MRLSKSVRAKLRKRKPSAHKGDFGRIFILAGSEGYTGAAHLAGQGALRCGAGLITLGVPRKIYPILARRQAEVMTRPLASTPSGSLSFSSYRTIQKILKTQNVLAIGPGLSQDKQTQRLIRKLISHCKLPLVIDADGLNALRGHTGLLKKCKGRAILTPHPGEFIRVFGGKLTSKESDRSKRASIAAKKYHVFIVLKGQHTVIAAPDGKTTVNRTGNPGMASGGTGDVLTGMIAALIGQQFSLQTAASLGVYLHGLAGDLASKKIGQVSLTAGDLLSSLPSAIRKASH